MRLWQGDPTLMQEALRLLSYLGDYPPMQVHVRDSKVPWPWFFGKTSELSLKIYGFLGQFL